MHQFRFDRLSLVPPENRDLPPGFNPAAAAHSIRGGFIGAARDRTVSRLIELTEMQYDPTKVWGELAGRVATRSGTLEREPIPSPRDSEVYRTFLRFRELLQPSDAKILLGEISHYASLVERDCSPHVNAALRKLESTLFSAAFPESADSDAAVNLDYLETILKSVTRMHTTDLRPRDLGFCGGFHFHPNGEPPNRGDRAQSYEQVFPMLVISTIENPRGLAGVHLLHGGESEQLF